MVAALLRSCIGFLAWPAVTYSKGNLVVIGYFCAITFGSFWNITGLLNEMTLRYASHEDFGRIRLYGGLGFASAALLTGFLVDALSVLGLWVLFVENLLFGVSIAIVSRAMARTLPDSPGRDPLSGHAAAELTAQAEGERAASETDSKTNGGGDFMQFLLSRHTLFFFFVVWTLGVGEGIMQTYTYVRIQLLPHGDSLVMGFGAACMIISEIPFFTYSAVLAKKFGVMAVATLALVCMAVRQLWIASLWDAWWLLSWRVASWCYLRGFQCSYRAAYKRDCSGEFAQHRSSSGGRCLPRFGLGRVRVCRRPHQRSIWSCLPF
eukprot:TRINITY_DN19115_c0_g1_i1.p1 TRINITY_DN19115_c0_g1~~TRINITY_DN19115_c0_g1_i1.p1  ORF type:complete len:321 (+),score=34.65 TRINITY_DN19115_c0_g1_i1:530-1492(+)